MQFQPCRNADMTNPRTQNFRKRIFVLLLLRSVTLYTLWPRCLFLHAEFCVNQSSSHLKAERLRFLYTAHKECPQIRAEFVKTALDGTTIKENC